MYVHQLDCREGVVIKRAVGKPMVHSLHFRARLPSSWQRLLIKHARKVTLTRQSHAGCSDKSHLHSVSV